MGLDWIAQARADGTPAEATLGMKRLSREDPETIEKFREIVDSYRVAVKARDAKPGDPFHDFWMRDFNVIVDNPSLLKGTDNWSGEKTKAEEDVEILKEAIAYLRFWGERGHSIFCWS